MGYAFQATVTVPAPSGALSNFTLALTGTDTKLKTVANGGQIQHTTTRTYGSYTQTVPADLILSADAAGTSLYSWGFDFYDPVNGVAKIWVLIPSYSAGLTIYVSIGNGAVSTYQGGSIGSEFDTNTKLACHFPDGTTLSLADFSTSGYNGTNTGLTAGAGKIDGAAVANGSSYGTIVGSGLNLTGSFTVSIWLKTTGTGVLYCRGTYAGTGYYIGINTGGIGYLVIGGTYIDTNGGVISDGTWHNFSVSYDVGAFRAYLYIDGVLVNNNASGNPASNAGPAYIAQYQTGAVYVTGSLDELRVSSAPRSASWIATEYANQNNLPAMSAFTSLSSGGAASLPYLGCQ